MKRSRFARPNPGKDFEDRVQEALRARELPHDRENVARMGVKASQGLYDFKIYRDPPVCFDCKSVGTGSNLTMPPMATPKVKTHQLAALRNEHGRGRIAGLLIEYRHLNKVYWLGIDGLNELHASEGLVSSLKPIHCERYGKEIVDMEIEGIWEVG